MFVVDHAMLYVLENSVALQRGGGCSVVVAFLVSVTKFEELDF